MSVRIKQRDGKVQGLPLLCFTNAGFMQTNTASLSKAFWVLKQKMGQKEVPVVFLFTSEICVGGYSLAAVTLAGTLARAPALVLATHWYLPSIRLDREGMYKLLGLSTAPKSPSNSSWPLRRQVMLAEEGRALQWRVTLPPSFCTMDIGSSVNTGTSSKEKQAEANQTS